MRASLPRPSLSTFLHNHFNRLPPSPCQRPTSLRPYTSHPSRPAVKRLPPSRLAAHVRPPSLSIALLPTHLATLRSPLRPVPSPRPSTAPAGRHSTPPEIFPKWQPVLSPLLPSSRPSSPPCLPPYPPARHPPARLPFYHPEPAFLRIPVLPYLLVLLLLLLGTFVCCVFCWQGG